MHLWLFLCSCFVCVCLSICVLLCLYLYICKTALGVRIHSLMAMNVCEKVCRYKKQLKMYYTLCEQNMEARYRNLLSLWKMTCLFGITDVYCMEPSVISGTTAVRSHVWVSFTVSFTIPPTYLPVSDGNLQIEHKLYSINEGGANIRRWELKHQVVMVLTWWVSVLSSLSDVLFMLHFWLHFSSFSCSLPSRFVAVLYFVMFSTCSCLPVSLCSCVFPV